MSNPIDNRPRMPGTNIGEPSGRSPVARREDAPAVAGEKNVHRDGSPETSGRLRAVQDAIANTPEVDRARVESIKERIAAGDYPVDADRVAAKFIELEKLLND